MKKIITLIENLDKYQLMTIPAIIIIIMLSFSFNTNSSSNKIGVVLPLSGENSLRAKSYLNGLQLAAEHANKILGKNKNKITILVRDYGNDSEKTAKQTIDLIYNNGVKAIIGGVNTKDTRIIQALSEQSETPFITGICTHFEITNGGFNYTFRNITDDKRQFESLTEYIKEKYSVKQCMLIVDNELYGQDGAKKYEEIANKYEQKVLLTLTCTPKSFNNNKLLNKILQIRPEAVVLLTSSYDAAMITRQAREANYPGIILGPSLLSTNEFRKFAGIYSEGVLTTLTFNIRAGGQRSEYFSNEYTDKYGKAPDTDAAMGYESMMVAALSIQNDKNDRHQIKDFLRNLHGWQSISGSGGFDENGNQLRSAEVAVIKNKQIIPVSMESLF